MQIEELRNQAREIWGDEPMTLDHIVATIGVVYGDICRQARKQHEQQSVHNEALQKELGNLIFSCIRWCDDLGFDAQACIARAANAQQQYVAQQKEAA